MTLTQRAVLLKIQKLPRNLWRKQQKSSLQKSALSRQLSRLWKKFHQFYNFTKKVKTEWWWTFWPNSCSTISTAGRGGGKRKLGATNSSVNSQFTVWNMPIPAVHAQKQYSISTLKIVQSWNIEIDKCLKTWGKHCNNSTTCIWKNVLNCK